MKMTRTLTSAPLIALLFLIVPLTVFGKKVKYISLQSQKVDTVSRFAALKILDFRSAKDTIGVGSFGLSGLSPLCLERVDELNTYLSKRFVFNNPASNDTLIVALYAFCANIDVTGAGIKAFHFDADCYLGSNGKYKSAGVARFYNEIRNHSAAGEYVSAVTDSVFDKIVRTKFAIDSALVDKQFILNGRSAELAQIPVYNQTVADGLYRTAKDFFNNTPSETGAIRWTTSDMMAFNFTAANGSKAKMKAKDFFAICDKGRLYKASGDGLAKMKFLNKGFYFSVLLKGESTHTWYEKYGATVGFLGAMTGSLIDPGKEMKYYDCKIDFRTGEYYPVLASEMVKETNLEKEKNK